jgi:hypothetical protein
MKNVIIFLITLSLLVLYIYYGFPFGILFERSYNLTALFRILFCLILIIRIIRTFKALPMLFGHSPSIINPKLLTIVQLLLVLPLAVGLFTDYVALGLLTLSLFLNFKSKYYSIEDIYIQNILFHLPFMASGLVLSFDQYLGISPVFSSATMFNSFFLSNSLIMLSAGYEKFKSKLWLEGKGALTFLQLPHLVKERFHWIHVKFKNILYPLGYLVMGAEFGMLFFVGIKYIILIPLVILTGFSVSLFVIVDISFIGQVLFLVLALFLGVVVDNWDIYGSMVLLAPHVDLFSGLALIANIGTLVTIFYYPFARTNRIALMQKFLSGINSPIGVFNEKHLFGFYTYRLTRIDDGREVMLLEAFDLNGFPGKYQFFYPRFFQGAMYPVTDFCLGVLKYGRDSTFKRDQIIDLCYAGLLSQRQTNGEVNLFVKKFDFNDTIGSYRLQTWHKIAECSFEDKRSNFKLINIPPKIEKTFRQV